MGEERGYLLSSCPGSERDTVDFTSDGTPVVVAAGNLWFVYSIGCNINVANRTNHKFPAATPTGVPSEVKSTVRPWEGPGYHHGGDH